MSAHELLGFEGGPGPREPKAFEAGKIRRVWLRTEARGCESLRTMFGAHVPLSLREVLWSKGFYLAPWSGPEKVVSWGVEAVFAEGLVERWTWRVGDVPPPSWIGESAGPPATARLVVVGQGQRFVVNSPPYPRESRP